MTATTSRHRAGTVLEARGLHVEFVSRGGAVARAVDGADLPVARRRDRRAGGRVRLAARPRWPGPCSAWSGRARGEVFLDGAPLDYGTRALRAFRRRVQLVLQDPPGRSTRGTPSTSRSPRGSGCTACPPPTPRAAPRASWSRRRCPRPACARRSGCSCATRTSCPAGSASGSLIAGALALAPELLIADEPVSSLDASIRGEILALLLKLRDELGLGVLVVTHDLGLAWNIADRIAVMYLGRIVEAGPTEEVLRDPQHPYTQALLSVVPEIERIEPVVLTGEMPDPTRIPSGCRFHPRCPALADGTGRRARASRTRCRRDPAAGAAGARPATTWRATWWPTDGPGEPRAGWLRRRCRARCTSTRRPGPRARPGAVRRVVLRRPARRPRARPARAGRGRRRRGGVGAASPATTPAAARGVQRLPAPRLAAVPDRARRGRRSARPRARCAAPTTRGPTRSTGSLLRAPHTDGVEIDPPAFSLHPVAVGGLGGLRLRATSRPAAAAAARRRESPSAAALARELRDGRAGHRAALSYEVRPTARSSPRTTTSATTAARCTPS